MGGMQPDNTHLKLVQGCGKDCTWDLQAAMMFSVPLTFTSCMSFLLAVLAAAGAAVAQWNTVSHPAMPDTP